MEQFEKKYKILRIKKTAFLCIFFGLMVLAFLTGLTGVIVCAVKSIDSMFSFFMVLGFVLPIVMWIAYLVALVLRKDKAREKLDSELMESSLTADEVKRAKELGIDHLPEGCLKDRVLPTRNGNYTFINGFEYKIEQRQCPNGSLNEGPGYVYPYQPSAVPKFETVIITEDPKAADDTFSYDEETGQYVKAIDPKSVGDVNRYSMLYFYQGHRVGRLGERDNRMDIYLDYKDQDIAIELGFKEFDRTGFVKNVDISEVEIRQKGPNKVG